MHRRQLGNGNQIPQRWIGVAAGWREVTNNPLEQLVFVPTAMYKKHALLIGPTGSGKTTAIHHIAAQTIEEGHSLCVLDMRGDLTAAMIELCAGRVPPEKTAIIDLREKQRPFGFNPLVGKGEPYFRALNVLDVVESESESWGIQLAETLRLALMLLSEAGETITRLESLFYDPDFLSLCLSKCKSESVVGFWQRFQAMSHDKQAALATPVLNKVSLLMATGTLRRILGHPKPLDLGQHLDTPGSVLLVSLAVDETHGAGRMMGRLVLSAVCREIFARVQIPEHQRNPVLLIVDEFEHFGMDEFKTILAEGRRFGLSAVLAHQTLAQLNTQMRSMILGNVGTKFIFRCGREDGAVLSRDITGDPRGYDFADLPVGVAVLWHRGQDAIEVEINEPIFQSVGHQSPAAREYLRRIYARVETVIEEPVRLTQLPEYPDPPATQSRPTVIKSTLEDWLCD